MTRFKVFDVFHISSINQTVIVGDVIDGTVSAGMQFTIDNYRIKIESVEHVDGSIDGNWISRLGLKVKINDDNLLPKINDLLPQGYEIEIK